jgi:hypothetical protein
MAVTALSGQRWQGRSNAGTAPIVGSVSSNTTIKFSDNGSFTPTGSFTVQYVVVGGGGVNDPLSENFIVVLLETDPTIGAVPALLLPCHLCPLKAVTAMSFQPHTI